MIEYRLFEITIDENIYDSILEHVNKKPFPDIDGYGTTVYDFACDMNDGKYIWIRVHNHIGGDGDLDCPFIIAQLMTNKGSIGQVDNKDPTKLFSILHDNILYGVKLRRNYSI